MDKINNLLNQSIGDVYLNEFLSKHSSWKIGGPADLLVKPHTIEQIRDIIAYAYSMQVPLVVIGNGTNLLFCDKGVRGIVMKIGNNFSNYEIYGTKIFAEAGIWIPKLVNILSNRSLSGIEHAIGIPGTLGGLIYMNGGSGRECIGDIIRKVWVIDKCGNVKCLSKKECEFSYRKSSLQDSGYIIYKAELECEYKDEIEIKIKIENILHKRTEKFPQSFPNCGSVFLSNPLNNKIFGPPGHLIEKAGMKGFKIGDAQISEKHANFILNVDKATAQDVISLVQYIRKVIYKQYNLCLESEVKYVGEMGDIKALHNVGVNDSP